MSLGGGITEKEYTDIVNTAISESVEGAYQGPLFQIIYIEGGGIRICEGAVLGG